MDHDTYFGLPFVHLRFFNLTKNKLNTSGNNPSRILGASTLHGISLPTARLPIGKNTHIFSIDGTLNQLIKMRENGALVVVHVEDVLEVEVVLFEGVVRAELVFGDFQAEGVLVYELVDGLAVVVGAGEGLYAAVDADASALLLELVVVSFFVHVAVFDVFVFCLYLGFDSEELGLHLFVFLV